MAEDALKEFIQDIDNNKLNQPTILSNSNDSLGPNIRQKVDKIDADSDWVEIPLNILPYGKFYKTGTHIMIRPCKTKEIESFSIVNENNPYDVINKLNEVLQACTKIIQSDSSIVSYREIMYGDRDTLCILIAKASAKNGRKLEKNAYCTCSPNDAIPIELIPANYEYILEDEDIAEFFNDDTKVYEFPLEAGNTIKLAPPTIGLAQDMNTYIFTMTQKSNGKKIPNISFMSNFTYMKAGLGVKEISIEKLEQEEYNYGKLNDELFMFIDDAVSKMAFGIKKIKKICTICTLKEVSTSFGFPSGPRSLFIVPNAFKKFIRQRV